MVGLLTPMGSSATVEQFTRMVMFVGALASALAGVSALIPRVSKLQNDMATRAAGLAVRSCSVSTGLFACANLLLAATAPTPLLSITYSLHAGLLFLVSRTTARTSAASRYPGLARRLT